MSRGDRHQDRQTRRAQFRPTNFDQDPTDRRVLLTGLAVVVLLCLAGLIRWLS